jgi:DNA-binding transcriptional ArsR family regulator
MSRWLYDFPVLDAALDALSDRTRRRLIELLHEKPSSVGDLALAVDMTPAATSRHLRVLRDHDLVRAIVDVEDARVRRYEINPEPLLAVRAWLDQLAAFWDEQLLHFSRHANRVADPGVSLEAVRHKRERSPRDKVIDVR